MIASLLWKEWRECRWKMLVLFGVYLLLVLIAWAVERVTPLPEAQFAVLLLCLIMPGVIAMGTIADEHVRGTSETLQSLPISTGTIFCVKSLAGLATLLLPLLAIETFNFLVLPREYHLLVEIEKFPAAPLAFLGLSTSLYLWTLALAAPRRTELGVATTYVLMFLVICLVALVGVLLFAGTINSAQESAVLIFVRLPWLLSPLGFLNGIAEIRTNSSPVLWFPALVQFVTWPLIYGIALRRFAHTRVLRIARPLDQATAPATTALTSLRFPILWKSWREYRLLVLIFSAFVLTFIGIDSMLSQLAISVGRYLSQAPDLLVFPCVLGMLMALILGTDVGARESEIHLENFWHSRPIPQAAYFRHRFAIGLLLSLLLVVMPAALAMGILSWQLAANSSPPPELLEFNAHFSKALYSGLYGPPGTIPTPPVFPDWPPSRDPRAVVNMLNYLTSAYETLADFLVFSLPQSIFCFSLAAFLASFSRRRIIPLVLSIGLSIAFPMVLMALASKLWMGSNWYWSSSLSQSLIFAYYLLILMLSLLLALLAGKSTTANWRARLERRLEPRTEILPAS